MYLPPKVTRRAFERLSEINAANEGKALRIAVEGWWLLRISIRNKFGKSNIGRPDNRGRWRKSNY